MSIEGLQIEIIVSSEVPIEKLVQTLAETAAKNDFRVKLDDEYNHSVEIKDNQFLYLDRYSELLPCRIGLGISEEQEANHPETECPLFGEWLFDRRISTFRSIAAEIDIYCFNFSRHVTNPTISFEERLFDFLKAAFMALNGIRASVWGFYNLVSFDPSESDWTEGEELLKLCNRDIVFHMGMWYSMVNFDHYGGETQFRQTLEQAYSLQNRHLLKALRDKNTRERFPQNYGKIKDVLKSGIHPPIIHKMDKNKAFIKIVDDYPGTESGWTDRELKLFESLAAKRTK